VEHAIQHFIDNMQFSISCFPATTEALLRWENKASFDCWLSCDISVKKCQNRLMYVHRIAKAKGVTLFQDTVYLLLQQQKIWSMKSYTNHKVKFIVTNHSGIRKLTNRLVGVNDWEIGRLTAVWIQVCHQDWRNQAVLGFNGRILAYYVKGKGKEEYLHSAIYTMHRHKVLRYGSHSYFLQITPCNTPCL